ncbi:menaquinone-dependent protoporphyrinogen oxidase [Formivibrio citricus]|uniref:Protoporphyrinogen IX dehydrogenase [quinone] n=1 Tax=Formivibrio citricus TaxID=83765 RepID=A0A1I4WDY1_9NEIS|nr:menaquinone-dependent protoporphyrinogen IX dehydrogenase [Formivibrio citricus]SFN11971.1 menaquinone-dependent protoporphyrinogen oxidase [Formivibrio citricus]
MTDVLFLYSTREGQTYRICECMAEEVKGHGRTAVSLSLDDPQAAQALLQSRCVVMGASIHYGHLPANLYAFIEAHRSELESRPNAFFCVNLTARKPGKNTPEGSAYMRRFLKMTAWRPQKLAVFPGALLYTRYTWYDRLVIRFIMWITGGPTDPARDVEFTDWDEIRRFARSLF